ncbi:MAG: hypothetical protein OEU32_15170, partial [Acidimicrobiia bacterium]|nr:hypothetical protein [Acidimicrobiia bacterium]
MQRSVARLAAGVSLVALVALGCSPSTDVTVAGRPDGTPSPDAPQSSPPDPTPSPAQPTATPLADVPELPDLVEEV